MKDFTLVSVNWNQQKVTELMLKSFAKHYQFNRNLILVDNGSTDNSKQFFRDNNIPFIDCPINLGHENALNMVYPLIKTRYALIVDTDIEFVDNIEVYFDKLDDKCIVAGDLITGDQFNGPVIPRIGAWFFLFDIQRMKSHGIYKFRDTHNWNYDVGSWMTEQIFNHGYTHHHIPRKPGNIDFDVIGMDYGTHYHLGKMSWEKNHHSDRINEINMRMKYVLSRLEFYKDINLNNSYK